MLPFIFAAGAGAALVSAAFSQVTSTEGRINSRLRKGDLKGAFDIYENQFEGESFADLDREEIFSYCRDKEYYQANLKALDAAYEKKQVNPEEYTRFKKIFETKIQGIDDWLNK